jgi:hypothetical protein
MNIPQRRPGRQRGPDPGRAPEPEHLAYMNWVAGQVGERGWAVSVAAPDDGPPSWAYSVGLWLTSQFGELVVCGAPADNMTGIIDSIGALLAEGAELEPGDVLTDICPARLCLQPVDLSWRKTSMFAVADEFYGFVRPPYLQVVWADRAGRFPWDRRFAPEFTGAQPFCWLPKDDNPPTAWTRIDKGAA